MDSITRVMAGAAAVVTLAGGTLAEVKIEEKLLSPLGQGFSYTPSPAPADLATIGPAGSRLAVYRDGEAGPKFDEIIATNPTMEGGGGLQLIFSPDGSRLAYVARKRGEFKVMVDGEEVASGNIDNHFNTIEGLGFTPDSKHWFYRVRQTRDDGAAPWRFVMDGVASPELGPQQIQAIVSPVGNGYILLGRLQETGQPVYIRDGQIVDDQPTQFLYRHDGKLYTVHATPDGSEQTLKLDGEELWTGAYSVQQIVSADVGDGWALIGSPTSGTNVVHAIVNGELFESPLDQAFGADRVTFSADGSRWMALMAPGPGRQFLTVDGSGLDEYLTIQEPSFSPDSKRFAFWGRSQTGSYLVIDDEEQDGVATTSQPVVWSEDGAHIGWAETAQVGSSPRVCLDGECYSGQNQLMHMTLGISPDGSRLGFIEASTVTELSADGVTKYEGVRVVPTGGGRANEFRAMPKGFVYSPDSRYIVYYGAAPQQGGNGLYINNTRFIDVQSSVVIRLGFSPDCEHFFVTMGVGNGRGLFVDGEMVMQHAATPFESDENSWHIDDNGVLHFLVADNEGIKRVSVTPSPDRTLESALGG